MSPAQVALKKIAEAVGVLGWERMGILEGSDPCGGMVIGTSEYVKGIEGALVGAALHGIGGSVEPMGAHDTDTDGGPSVVTEPLDPDDPIIDGKRVMDEEIDHGM